MFQRHLIHLADIEGCHNPARVATVIPRSKVMLTATYMLQDHEVMAMPHSWPLMGYPRVHLAQVLDLQCIVDSPPTEALKLLTMVR